MTFSREQVSQLMIEKAVDTILESDERPCECRPRRSTGHDSSPPCETRRMVTNEVKKTIGAIVVTMRQDNTPRSAFL